MRIVRVGIRRVVAQKRYHADKMSREIFKRASVKLVVIDDSLEKYDRQ
jgi:deoxycytidylate deaminase